MPVRQRLVAICAFPFTLVAVFMSAPGLIGTLYHSSRPVAATPRWPNG